MNLIYVSLIVSNDTTLIKNELLRMDVPLDPAEADEYLEELDKWIAARPVYGQKEFVLPEEPVYVAPPTDAATLLAARLPQILGKRDPFIFAEHDFDFESEASVIERRPYDGSRLGSDRGNT